MVDGIAYTSILGNALVLEVNLAFCVNGNVLEEGVACDGVEDIGFALLVEVDNLGIAATLEVEHTVVVPSVLVVTDKKTLGVCRKGCLACA